MRVSREAQGQIEMLFESRRRKAREDAAKLQALGEGAGLMIMLEGIFAERREGVENAKRQPLPDGISAELTHAGDVPAEWVRWMDADPEKMAKKAILFVHGGGFASGSAISRRALCARLVRHAKVDALSIDYRQCPEYRYPAHLDDCVTAYVHLLRLGYRAKDITLFGESAGANLVLCMGHYLRDHDLPSPGGIVAFSPVTDMKEVFDSWITRATRDAMIGEDIDEADVPGRLARLREGGVEMMRHYVGAQEAESPYASPVRGDFHGYPPTMIQVGTEERLYDDAVAVYEKAKAAGVDVVFHEWEGMFHVFALFDSPETEAVCGEIAGFVRG